MRERDGADWRGDDEHCLDRLRVGCGNAVLDCVWKLVQDRGVMPELDSPPGSFTLPRCLRGCRRARFEKMAPKIAVPNDPCDRKKVAPEVATPSSR